MNAVLRIYPKPFRDRYGEEITMLLESSATPRRDVLNVVWNAVLDRFGAFFAGGRRRTPRYLLYAVAWILGAYAAADLIGRFTTVVLRWVLTQPTGIEIPQYRSQIGLERLAVFGCIAAAAVVAYVLSWRFWRRTPAGAIAAVALTSLFVSVVRVDSYMLTSIHVSVQWDYFWLTVAAQAIWVALAALLVVVLRRTPRPGWFAPFAVVAFAYANSVLAATLVGLVFDLPGNPFTTYWRSLVGSSVFIVTDNGLTAVAVLNDGWWTSIVMALIAGCTVAAHRVPRTAHSPELAS